MQEAMFLSTYASPAAGDGRPARRRVIADTAGRARPGARGNRPADRRVAGAANRCGRLARGGIARADLCAPAGRQSRRARLCRPQADRRGIAIRQTLGFARLKDLVREQYLIVLLDDSGPSRRFRSCCPTIAGNARKRLRSVAGTCGPRGSAEEGSRRLARVETAALPAPERSTAPRSELRDRPRVGEPWEPHAPPRGISACYKRLLRNGSGVPPVRTAVAHPCDEVSLEGAVQAARPRADRPDPRGAAGPDRRCGQDGAGSTYRARSTTRRTAAIRRRRRWGWSAREGRGADEGQPAHRRADGRRGGGATPGSAPHGGSASASSWICRDTPNR